MQCLTNVVDALSTGWSYVPYRESKLTQLLKESLGGNSKTTIIAQLSPDSKPSDIYSTLQFCERAQFITCCPRINKVYKAESEFNMF